MRPAGSLDRELALVGDEESREELPYTCAHCGTIITTRGERLSPDGAHQHSFSNPAGLVFRILCFRDAPGCFVIGNETDEHTWFAGFMWCYALCTGCNSHLGWRYRSTGEDAFFGLIADQLIPPQSLPSR